MKIGPRLAQNRTLAPRLRHVILLLFTTLQPQRSLEEGTEREPTSHSKANRIFEFKNHTNFCKKQPNGQTYRLRFCVLNFLSILSGFLSWEKMTQKWQRSIAEQFSKLQFLSDKIDQSTTFAQLPSAKKAILVSIYKLLRIAQLLALLLCISFCCERKSERIEGKFMTQNPNLGEMPPFVLANCSSQVWRTNNERLMSPFPSLSCLTTSTKEFKLASRISSSLDIVALLLLIL